MEIEKLEIKKLGARNKIDSFEDLKVYQLAREFRKKIYRTADQLPQYERYNLADQMRRAAVSLTNNIAEGYGRFHYKENIQFCRQARGSLNELIDDLNACLDEEYVTEQSCGSLKDDAKHLIKVLNGYIASTARMEKGTNARDNS